MRRYVERIILYNLSHYTSFLVRRKYSYICSALKNNQEQQFSAQTKKLCLFRLFRHNLQRAVLCCCGSHAGGFDGKLRNLSQLAHAVGSEQWVSAVGQKVGVSVVAQLMQCTKIQNPDIFMLQFEDFGS